MSDSSEEPDATIDAQAESDPSRDSTTSGTQGERSNDRESTQTASTLRRLLKWLWPNPSDDPDSDRTGLLSTRTEVHAVVIGITAGAHWGLSGDMQLINDVVGVALLGDRARRANQIPQKHIDQAKEEVPHFLAGVVVGYAATQTDVLSEIGTSVGW